MAGLLTNCIANQEATNAGGANPLDNSYYGRANNTSFGSSEGTPLNQTTGPNGTVNYNYSSLFSPPASAPLTDNNTTLNPASVVSPSSVSLMNGFAPTTNSIGNFSNPTGSGFTGGAYGIAGANTGAALSGVASSTNGLGSIGSSSSSGLSSGFGLFGSSSSIGPGSGMSGPTSDTTGAGLFSGSSIGGAIGGLLGGVLGSALGPVGSLVGGFAGKALGSALGNSASPSETTGSNTISGGESAAIAAGEMGFAGGDGLGYGSAGEGSAGNAGNAGAGAGDAYAKGGLVQRPRKQETQNLYAEGGIMTDDNSTQDQSQPPNQFLVGPDAQKMLQPNPQIQKIVFARLEALNQDDAQTFKTMVTPDVAYVLGKVIPELEPVLQRFAEMNSDQSDQGQSQDDGSSQDQNTPAQGGQDQSNQQTPGFAKGGMISLAEHFGLTKPAASNSPGGPDRTGYVNKGIPSNSLASGGMAMGHVTPPPHPSMVERPAMPAASKFSSRAYNNPKYADGGTTAGGGLMQQPDQQTGPTGNPDTDQAIQNQKIAEQVVPASSTADNIDAKVSKGEFVMDAPTVMFYGMGKLIQMQEKAHQEIATHIGKQDAQQKDQSGQGPPQQQAQPPQQAQQQQQAAPMPPAQVPSTQPPNATEARIQQTNTPRPSNPFSLMG